MLHLETHISEPFQSLIFKLLRLLLLLRDQFKYLCGSASLVRLGNVVVLIKVLRAIRKLSMRLQPLRMILRLMLTISPISRTFSPRTRYMPLSMSAYFLPAKVRSTESCSTRLPSCTFRIVFFRRP